MDDLVLFADSREQLVDWQGAITERCAALRLRLHPAQPQPVDNGQDALLRSLRSTFAHCQHADTYRLRRQLLRELGLDLDPEEDLQK